MWNQLIKIMGWESFDMVRFDFGPLHQGQTRIAKLKSAYNLFIIGPRSLQCETNLQEIMGWESFDVVTFGLGPLLQGQMRTAELKSAITCLLLVLEVCTVKPTYIKSWAGNLLNRCVQIRPWTPPSR